MLLSKELSFLISAVVSESSQPNVNSRDLDWHRIAQLSEWHSIVPLVYAFLEKEQFENIPDEIFKELRDNSMEQAVSNMMFLKTSMSLCKNLIERGISVFPMKGAIWAWLLYEKPGQRAFGDIDLFVDSSQILAGLEVLDENGFAPDPYRQYLLKTEKLRKLYLSTDYQLPLVPTSRNHVKSVEIQWNCSYPRYRYSFNWAQLMAKAMDVEFMKNRIQIPSWEMQLVMMVIHHAGVEQWDKLKYIGDFVRLLRRNAEHMDWLLIRETVRKAGFLKLFLQSLGLVYKLTGEDYIKYFPDEKMEKYPSAPFYNNIIMHWENTRHIPTTKSMQIFNYNMKYRDRFSDKLKILAGHINYLTRFSLIFSKARWYSNR